MDLTDYEKNITLKALKEYSVEFSGATQAEMNRRKEIMTIIDKFEKEFNPKKENLEIVTDTVPIVSDFIKEKPEETKKKKLFKK